MGQCERESGVEISLFLSVSLIVDSLLAGPGVPRTPAVQSPAVTVGWGIPVALPLALPCFLAAEGKSCSVPRDCSESTTPKAAMEYSVVAKHTQHLSLIHI